MPDPIPFPFEPDGSFPIVERFAYLTEILTAESGREQRRRLRVHPTGAQEFHALEEEDDARLLNAWLYANQDKQIAVPLWQYRTVLASPWAPTDTELEVERDTQFLDEDQGEDVFALAVASPRVYELLHLQTVSGGGDLLLSSGLVETWPAGSTIVPVRLGRMSPASRLAWFNQTMLGGSAAFDLEAWGPSLLGLGEPDPAGDPGYASSIYGRQETEPGRLVPLEDEYRRSFTIVGSPLGARGVVSQEAAPALARPYLWQGDTPYDMKAWLAQRRGRAVPFWLWPYERELQLAAPILMGAGTATIRHAGYTDLLFPGTAARRHIRFRLKDGTAHEAGVLAAVDNLDGTETLTLAEPPAFDIPVAALTGFRRFCRLDEEEVTIEHSGPAWSEATVRVVELPIETPYPEAP